MKSFENKPLWEFSGERHEKPLFPESDSQRLCLGTVLEFCGPPPGPAIVGRQSWVQFVCNCHSRSLKEGGFRQWLWSQLTWCCWVSGYTKSRSGANSVCPEVGIVYLEHSGHCRVIECKILPYWVFFFIEEIPGDSQPSLDRQGQEALRSTSLCGFPATRRHFSSLWSLPCLRP